MEVNGTRHTDYREQKCILRYRVTKSKTMTLYQHIKLYKNLEKEYHNKHKILDLLPDKMADCIASRKAGQEHLKILKPKGIMY